MSRHQDPPPIPTDTAAAHADHEARMAASFDWWLRQHPPPPRPVLTTAQIEAQDALETLAENRAAEGRGDWLSDHERGRRGDEAAGRCAL